MTSIARDFAQIPENKLYIVTATMSLTDASGTNVGSSLSAGTVLRDMGKTIVDFETGNFLRKVQVVPTTGSSDPYGAGYIKIAGATYGGSGSGTSPVVRLN